VRRTSRVILWPLYACTAFTATGCGPTINADFDSAEPAARNAAIVEAASKNDRAAVPDLVRMLDSDDPATRLLAINALEKITGERLGYEHTAQEHERVKAVDQWRAYVATHFGQRASSLTSSPPHLLTSLRAGGGH
jgi:HEAT repeat protein